MQEIFEESKKVRAEVRERATGYVTAAFALVAGLAWNEAIKALIEFLFPLSKDTILAKFIYAIVLTVILAFVAIYLVRLSRPKN